MTVVDPAPQAVPWNPLVERPPGASAAVDHVQRLDSSPSREDPSSRAAEYERVDLRFLGGVRAWMLVPLVDLVLIMLPLAWRPPQIHAVVTMAVLGTLLLTGGTRYRARLHLSVLDELPTILTRLLTATAAVASVILYLYQREAVIDFLQTACQATALVVVGRVITTRLQAALTGRR
jgi:hypothetical protein